MAIPPNKKRGKKLKKEQPSKDKGQIQYKTIQIKDEKESKRLDGGVPKVQISGLKTLINSAKNEKFNSILIHFELKKKTQDWLIENKISFKNWHTKKGNAFQIENNNTLISWQSK